jgi:outer membrane protein
MKNFFRLAIVALFVAAMPNVTKAQSTKKGVPVAIAHFDLDSVLDLMPAMKAASDSAESYYKMLEDELYRMQAEYDTRMEAYEKNKDIWSPTIKGLKEKEIYDLQQNMQLYQQSAQVDYANYRAKLVKPIFDSIQAAVKRIAIRRNYGYVIDSSKSTGVVLYANVSDDIFKDVLAELHIPPPVPKAPGK